MSDFLGPVLNPLALVHPFRAPEQIKLTAFHSPIFADFGWFLYLATGLSVAIVVINWSN